jgi:DNA polymerase III epsilon subunit-like protein
MPETYIVVDLETTGVKVLEDLPVQLAYEVYFVNTEKKIWLQNEADCFWINPKPKSIDPQAEMTHGISQTFLDRKGEGLSLVASKWHSVIWNYHPTYLIGYNIINFDFPIIVNWLYHYSKGKFKFPPLLGILDVMFLAQRHFKMRGWPKLSESARKLNLEFNEEDLHDARDDVRLTWRVFAKIRGWKAE